ncbi:hypothetical protein LINGRAHAP2_LOCUS11498 [Linum grandiflorum]
MRIGAFMKIKHYVKLGLKFRRTGSSTMVKLRKIFGIEWKSYLVVKGSALCVPVWGCPLDRALSKLNVELGMRH